jgi:hypothetical protein
MGSAAVGSKTIPQVGEVFLGDDPSVVKVIKITAGFDCGDVTGIETQAAHVLLNIPAGTLIEKVSEWVVTAWTASTTFTVGDCDSAAQFVVGALGSTTAATWKPETGLQVSQYYNTPSAITMTVAGANPAAGKSDFFIWYNLAGQNTTY